MKKIIKICLQASRLPYATAAEKLACSACPGIFPADIIGSEKGERLELYYHVEGFRKLGDITSMAPEEVLRLILAAAANIQTCSSWFWFPEEYVLSEDTVYVKNPDQVCFLWIPDRQKMSASRRFSCLLHSLKGKTSDRGKAYIDSCLKMMAGGEVSWSRFEAGVHDMLRQEYWLH